MGSRQPECDSTDNKPPRTWPAKTPEESNAQWPGGHQPKKLECWSKDSAGDYLPCWYIKTLEDHERGWPAKCTGLLPVDPSGISDVKPAEQCMELCKRNAECPVWINTMGDDGRMVCSNGYGTDCYAQMSGSRGGPQVVSGQRLQHGSVQVLWQFSQTWIKSGLRVVFDSDYFKTREDATDTCKKMCYSDLHCQWWLYSTENGCYVESPPQNQVPYPLVEADIDRDSDEAKTVIMGEYIQHRCPERNGEFTAEDEHANNTFSIFPWNWNWFGFHWPWEYPYWPWWMYFLSSVWCCCCCCCCVFFCGAFGFIKRKLNQRQQANASKSKKGSKRGDDSDSSYSSDSEDEGKKPSSEALLTNQHMNTAAMGYGHQAVNQYHGGYAR